MRNQARNRNTVCDAFFFYAQYVMHLSTYARAVTHSAHTELIPPVNFGVGRNYCLKGFSSFL
jgi:hypothetical protein